MADCANTTAHLSAFAGKCLPANECRGIGRGFGATQTPIGAKPSGTGYFALINFAKSLERIFGYVLRFSLVLNAKSPRQNGSEWVQSACLMIFPASCDAFACAHHTIYGGHRRCVDRKVLDHEGSF